MNWYAVVTSFLMTEEKNAKWPAVCVLWWESKGFLAADFSKVAKDAYVHQWSFLVWFMQFHDRNRMVELLVCGFVFYRF